MGKTPQTIDDLFELARTDPEALERYRQKQVQEIISQAPPYMRNRLRGLQFTIDAYRRSHSNPLAVCIHISRLMHDSFDELQDLLNSMLEPGAEQHRQTRSARIIRFPSRTRRRSPETSN